MKDNIPSIDEPSIKKKSKIKTEISKGKRPHSRRSNNIWIVAIILFVLYVLGQEKYEPTGEQINRLIECRIDYCEELGYTPNYKVRAEREIYIGWDDGGKIYCYDEKREEHTFNVGDIWSYCKIEPRKNPLRKFSIFSYIKNEAKI